MGETTSEAPDPRAFRRALRAWFRRHRRDLPWREPRSLYRTVVSEFMLQQTQVTTVLPYFVRWMERFPDFAALASAPEEAVLQAWEGLGYYSRARRLQRLAAAIAARDAPPRTAAEWREFPGVGPYTAAAIASLAFDDPAACVDGNVVRVLARVTGDRTPFPDGAAAVKRFTPLAAALLDPRRPGEHNEAMMELGATVCVRRQPRCDACPLAALCVARRDGIAADLPRLAWAKPEARAVTRAWCERAGSLLLHRLPDDARRLARMHELPEARLLGVAPEHAAAAPLVARRVRSITRFRITETIVRLPPPAAPHPETVWVPLEDLGQVTFSGPHRRWVREILARRNDEGVLPGLGPSF